MNAMWNQKKFVVSVLSLGSGVLLSTPAFADNPIVQTSYTADPAPMVHEGRLYLYTSHDEDVTVKSFYTMNDWRLYSTVDMVNWTDHGSPAGYKTFSWGTGDAWAPQGIARNGKFYLYVPLNNNTGARIGVGVSNNIAGPFTDPLGKALAQSGSGDIDPTVFIDDDGQAYLYWGNANLWYVKLNQDMISYTGSPTKLSLTGYVEGPWFYKRGSLYYLVYAANGSGTEKLSYGTSSSPTGPWTYKGDIMPSGSTYTNHPGVVDYKGHSYFFYHNSALPNGGDFKRSVCVEEFTYGTDGGIPKIAMTTQGPAAIATLNPFEQVEAETIAFSAGLKTEVCSDTGGGMNVSSISNGDYIKVKEVDFGEGVTSFDARVSSAGSNAKIELHLDSQSGTLLGTCDVSSVSSWTTKTCAVTGATGKHDLFLKFTGGSGDLFKFNWWKFTGSGSSTGGAGGAGGAGSGGAGGSTLTNGGTGNVAGGSSTSSSGGGAVGTGGVSSTAGGKSGNTAGGTVAANGGSVSSATGGKSAAGGSGSSTGGKSATSNGSSTGGKSATGGGTSTSATGGSSAATAAGSSSIGGKSAAATGGQPGTSSNPGTGGKSAGSSAGSSAVTTQTSDVNSPDSGCSCRVGTGYGTSGARNVLWLLASALLIRRRRSSQR